MRTTRLISVGILCLLYGLISIPNAAAKTTDFLPSILFQLLDSEDSDDSKWTSRFFYKNNIAWRSRRDLTSSEFSDYFNQYSNQGFIIVDIDVRPEGSSALYSMVWQKNIDGRSWHEHRNLTSQQYHDLWVQYRDTGYRPLDIEAYMLNGNLRYAGIWIENIEGLAWKSTRDQTSSGYGDYFNQSKAEGYRPIDIEIYSTPSGMRVAAIWYKNVDGIAWKQLRNMDRTRYQQEFDDQTADGYTIIDFESYDAGSEQQYAAIWEKRTNRPIFLVKTDRSQLDYANIWRTAQDLGLRMVDFENYNFDGQENSRYGGIWIENEDRIRYDRMIELDQKIMLYAGTSIQSGTPVTNNLPGISVAIVRDGQMIYRRGIGFADVDAGKIAHGETIYSAASVSKVIGGTLAARLEERERLLDGTIFELNLTRPTSYYLGVINVGGDVYVTMPTEPGHTHTVEQLLSHLGCVAHYPARNPPATGAGETIPGIANQPTTHYSNAVAAVQSIWDVGLVEERQNNGGVCTIGVTTSYSTPAFTFLGAVLEVATGRNLNTLLETEIFAPNGLSNTRVMFETESLPANYDRAKPYTLQDRSVPPDATTNPNVELSGGYTNSSWKVLGGGIESTAVDLARFGWRTLNGDIVAAPARDSRMWTRVAPSGNGLAWVVGSDSASRRIATHSGSQNGARSYLRVYRDEGLVIAIMSNRRDHQGMEIWGLAAGIGNCILSDFSREPGDGCPEVGFP